MRIKQLELFRYKQNSRYLLIIIIALAMLFLTGCMKTEDEDVEVIIVATYYEEGSDYYYLIGGTIGCDSGDDEYYIIVDYNGIQYTVEDEILYEKYKDKIGEKVMGVMRYYIYDDEDRQCDIIWLY